MEGDHGVSLVVPYRQVLGKGTSLMRRFVNVVNSSDRSLEADHDQGFVVRIAVEPPEDVS